MKAKLLFAAAAALAASQVSVAALGAVPIPATSIIDGKVVDSVDHHPLGGVQVDAFNEAAQSNGKAAATTTTREDGSFSLPGLRSGAYHLELSKRGYALEIVTGVLIRSDEHFRVSTPFGMRSAVVTTGIGQTMETRI